MCTFQMMINNEEREQLEFNMGECVGMKNAKKLFHFKELGVVLTVLFTIEDPMNPIETSMTKFNLNDKGEATLEAGGGEEDHANCNDAEHEMSGRPVVDGKKLGTCCTIF